MRAALYSATGEMPVLGDVPEPELPDDGVLIRVAATGVCRSDWHAWLGHDPVPSLPWVPGHELAGTVAAAGPRVRHWSVGDRVTAPFACGCGSCEQCAAGDTQVCPRQTQPGFTHWGSFAELVAIYAADTNLVRLPDGVPFVDAAALGCRVATAHRAVVHQGRIAPGEWIAVHGCGGVGLSAIAVGTALGACVVAVDISEKALEAARELGAAATILASDQREPDEIAAEILSLTGGGAHVSIDALGSLPTMEASIGCLRPRGRHIQVGLMLGDASMPAVPMGRVIARELEILGSHGMPARDYPQLLGLVASGRLDVSRLVGRVIPLSEAPEALAAMSSPGSGSRITVVDLSL